MKKDFGGTDNWGEVKKLVASDGEPSDFFGSSVTIKQNTIIIGSPEDDDNSSNSGAAYIFEKDFGGTDNWGEVKKLVASDGGENDYFGSYVSMFNETAIIGAPKNLDIGAIYVFKKDIGGMDNWGEEEKLIPGDGSADDLFGSSFDFYQENETIIIANGDDDIGINSGSIYVFSTLSCNDYDLDNDFVIDIEDFLAVLAEFGNDCPNLPVECLTDFNKNGLTDIGDFLAVLGQLGNSCL